MRAAIKHISTIDGGDASKYQPAAADTFSVTLRLLIGPEDAVGEESFDMIVCSPSWLETELARDGFVVGRHRLIVRRYDFRLVQQVIAKLISRCSGETWSEIAEKISRLAYWEFEDYQTRT